MEKLKLVKVAFDMDSHEFSQGFVEVSQEHALHDYNSIIGSRMIDIVSISDEIAVIVDDEGLLVSGNPVFNVQFDQLEMQLAGTLLFASQKDTGEGLELISIRNSDFLELADKLKLRIIGETK